MIFREMSRTNSIRLFQYGVEFSAIDQQQNIPFLIFTQISEVRQRRFPFERSHFISDVIIVRIYRRGIGIFVKYKIILFCTSFYFRTSFNILTIFYSPCFWNEFLRDTYKVRR